MTSSRSSLPVAASGSTAADRSAIALVACLRHRIGRTRSCKCEECRCLVRVVALAREAVAMKVARRENVAKHARVTK